MQDQYYSQKLDRYFPTRLDFLLYAHDGRGLGHISRTVGVGLALKRLYPEKTILIISGSSATGMLIGPAALDWIKLPSYQTVLKGGVSEGQTGNAGFYKSVLGRLRAQMLRSMVDILRPRCVLVDHNPAGKRDELIEALQHTAENDCCWVLGLRGIIGDDRQLWSEKTASLVSRHYQEVLWYGDSKALGTEPVEKISRHFDKEVQTIGYVSRLQELKPYLVGSRKAETAQLACTISLPWLGEHTEKLWQSLYRAAKDCGPERGKWHLYVPGEEIDDMKELFAELSFCIIKPISEHYLTSLLHSKIALIYGGYNSLLDIMAAQIPALIVVRATKDREQVEHLERLERLAGTTWQVVEEQAITDLLVTQRFQDLFDQRKKSLPGIDINGAEKAAQYLHNCLEQS